MAVNRHWLWGAYLAIAEQGGRSEKQGRALLKSVFHNFEDQVDDVIEVFGDMSKLNAAQIKRSEEMIETEETALSSQNLTNDIRDEFDAATGRTSRAKGKNRDERGRFVEGGDKSESDPTGMNQLIRDAVRSRRVPPGVDPIEHMRASLRERRGQAALPPAEAESE